MKSSTIGIGIAILFIAIGGGSWVYSQGQATQLNLAASDLEASLEEPAPLNVTANTRQSVQRLPQNPWSPASISSVADESPTLPGSLPVQSQTSPYTQVAYKQPITSEDNASENMLTEPARISSDTASAAAEQEHVLRSSPTTGKIPASELKRANPLRTDQAADLSTAQSGVNLAVNNPADSSGKPITQMAMQAESGSSGFGGGFAAIPEPTGPSSNMLESAGFGAAPTSNATSNATSNVTSGSKPKPFAEPQPPKRSALPQASQNSSRGQGFGSVPVRNEATSPSNAGSGFGSVAPTTVSSTPFAPAAPITPAAPAQQATQLQNANPFAETTGAAPLSSAPSNIPAPVSAPTASSHQVGGFDIPLPPASPVESPFSNSNNNSPNHLSNDSLNGSMDDSPNDLSKNPGTNSNFSSNPSARSRQVRSIQSLEELEGTGIPGISTLEGAQTPHLTIEKILDGEVIVNEPTTVKTIVRNVGRSVARDITIKDRIPQGARLLSASPKPSVTESGELLWSLGNLEGNEQIIVEMRLLPFREGEIGSVAVVNYTSEASTRIAVTKPMLRVDVKAPQKVLLGQTANLEITISNPGTATARGVILEEYVPDGLYHKDGKVLINKNINTLKPKEAKRLTLPLTCVGSGNLINRLTVRADGNLSVEESTSIQALAPILNLEIAGAEQRFLERRSTYRLIVSNSGTASAQNVDLVLTLPSAVKFVSTNQSGVYEASTHTVHWALEELPAQESGEIELVVLPRQIGDHSMRFSGIGENQLKAEASKVVSIDGIAALSFDLVGQSHLIEVGKEAVYEIRVSNKGTKAAGNIQVKAALPEGLSFSKAEGPVQYQANGNVVSFESLSRLEPKGEKVYRIAAKCLADGDHRVSAQLVSDDLKTPITKQESTRVFQ